MKLKAIQTRYKGYHFRSRLEARWAVFFDTLGIKWEYEPEGFELPGGVRYLPDFRTTSPTGLVNWYEVKPVGVTSDPKVTAANAPRFDENWNDLPGMDVHILAGDPLDHICFVDTGYDLDGVRVCPRCGQIGEPNYGLISHSYGKQWDFGCGQCDLDTPDSVGYLPEKGLLAKVFTHKGSLLIQQPDLGRWLRRVHKAATAARSARFEYGQSGASR